MSYDDISAHKLMLEDLVRTRAYERAIGQLVRRGHRVLDFGCGSGILSFFASRAGAAAVYAVDKSKFIRLAKTLAEQNGFEDIAFYHDDEQTLELPDQVDVIVSEWMGTFALCERLLEPLLKVRDRYLAPGGVMIPGRIRLRAGFVVDESIHRRLSYFRDRPYGVDFSVIADWPFFNVELEQLDASQLSTDVVDLVDMDLLTYTKMPKQLRAVVSPTSSAEVFGICGWFEALLADDVLLKTGPADPSTHWKQLLFPLHEPFPLRPGKEVELIIQPIPEKGSSRVFWRWSISDGDMHIEMDDFVHRAWTMRNLARGRVQ